MLLHCVLWMERSRYTAGSTISTAHNPVHFDLWTVAIKKRGSGDFATRAYRLLTLLPSGTSGVQHLSRPTCGRA